MTRRTRLGRWCTGGAALLMAASLAACGSDDDDGGSDNAAAETSASEESGGADAFCEASVKLEAAFSSGPQVDDAAPPEEQQAALEEFGSTVEPLLSDAEDATPEEISDDVDTAAGIIRDALSGGDPAALDGPEFQEADSNIDQYMIDNCGFEQLEATGVDYEYEGIPDTVQAGTTTITFHNEGTELHEIGLLRVNDGVTESVEELLALPEEEAMTKATFVGGAFAEPGESDTTFMELEPGQYAAVCFVPQGTTHDTEGTGAPHFTLGMLAEFTVE